MSLQAVLFDFDGTLVNTERVHFASVRPVMEDYLKEKISDEEMQSMIGYVYMDRIRRMLKLRGIEDDALTVELEKEARKVMRAKEKPEELVIPGAPEFIKALHAAEVTLAVVTSTSRERVLKFMEPLGLADYFSTIIGSGEVQFRKPAPEPYEKAVADLNLDSASCVVFEDSTAGIDSAAGADIPTIIGIDTNNTQRELPGTHHVITDFTSSTVEGLQQLV